jgi:hypothetical protein
MDDLVKKFFWKITKKILPKYLVSEVFNKNVIFIVLLMIIEPTFLLRAKLLCCKASIPPPLLCFPHSAVQGVV